ncbi:hypothetical protein [Nocardia sp. NPDC019395]|uniref:AfsR/SARP family transcriptional regulator n=1 Tax=Nocardia sp. NPDC019395 TaxID=3154686 RepID=UPI0033EE5333
MVEADPTGGSLAQLACGDAQRGLVSLAKAAASPSARVAGQVWEHTQVLGSGVRFLAAPTDPGAVGAVLSAPVTAAPRPAGLGANDPVVIADCGVSDQASPAAPIVAGANATLFVVRGGLTDPVRAGCRIREVAAACRRCAVLLIGSDDGREFAEHLGVPVLGRLPVDRRGAAALLTGGPHAARETSSLMAAARGVVAAIHAQLQPSPSRACNPRRAFTPCLRLPSLRRHPGLDVCNTRRALHVYRMPAPSRDGDAASMSRPRSSGALGLEVAATDESTTAAAGDASEGAPVAAAANEPACNAPVLTVEVFGPLRVRWRTDTDDVDITARLQPRGRELLALLALHPEGITRETLIADLWGERCPRRPVNALNTAISRLVAVISTATDGAAGKIVTTDHFRYRLDPRITTDYQSFARAVRRRRHANCDTERSGACREIVETAGRGVLAADLSAAWATTIREAARRDTITAVGSLAATVVEHDPRRTLDLLETALDHDPFNELLWRDILRLHARLGEHSAIDRSMSLLAHKLAGIGEKPTQETQELAERLRQKAPN